MTNPDNHKSKAIHVLKTWGRRCDKLLFVTEGHTNDLPNAVKVDIQHGREHLTAKTMNAFDHIYEHHLVSVTRVMAM
jgi:glycoprotein-N-acetylgalactosamine 3-beta-galactosyltransferase